MTNTNTVFKGVMAAVVVAGVMGFSATQASAVSSKVRSACMSDYLNYCSQHGVNVSKVGRCMRKNGNRLSKRCVRALVSAGYVSKAEVARRSASLTP